MKPLPEVQQSDWQKKTISVLMGGYDGSKEAQDVPDNAFTGIQNLRFLEGALGVDTGYHQLGQTLNSIPLGVFQFFLTSGTSFLLAACINQMYVWNTTLSQWQLVGDNTGNTTTTSIVNAGGTAFPVVATTGITTSDLIAILLDDGSQLITTIVSIVGLTINTTLAVPAGRHAASGTALFVGAELNGSADIEVNFVTVPQNNWCIFTNGVDPVQYFDGTFLRPLAGLAGINVTAARVLMLFHGSLILMDTTESGARFPQIVRRSSSTDITNWTTNNAGFDELQDTEDFILQSSLLGPYMIIYRETSIMRVTYVGQLTLFYFYEYMIEGEGLMSGGTIAELGGTHMLVGNAGIYEYAGNYDLTSIGDAVFYLTLGPQGNLSPSFRQRSLSFYVQELDEFWFFYPSGVSSNPNVLLRCYLENYSWYIVTFPNQIGGFGFYVSQATVLWNQLVGTWQQQTWNWDSRTIQANSPVTLLCDAVNNIIYEYNYLDLTYNGVPVAFVAVTKDYGDPDTLMRINSLRCYGEGNSIAVNYSVDGGKTYQNYGTLNFGTSGPTQQLLNLQVVFQYIRFQFSGNDPTFKLDWYRLEIQPETTW